MSDLDLPDDIADECCPPSPPPSLTLTAPSPKPRTPTATPKRSLSPKLHTPKATPKQATPRRASTPPSQLSDSGTDIVLSRFFGDRDLPVGSWIDAAKLDLQDRLLWILGVGSVIPLGAPLVPAMPNPLTLGQGYVPEYPSESETWRAFCRRRWPSIKGVVSAEWQKRKWTLRLMSAENRQKTPLPPRAGEKPPNPGRLKRARANMLKLKQKLINHRKQLQSKVKQAEALKASKQKLDTKLEKLTADSEVELNIIESIQKQIEDIKSMLPGKMATASPKKRKRVSKDTDKPTPTENPKPKAKSKAKSKKKAQPAPAIKDSST